MWVGLYYYEFNSIGFFMSYDYGISAIALDEVLSCGTGIHPSDAGRLVQVFWPEVETVDLPVGKHKEARDQSSKRKSSNLFIKNYTNKFANKQFYIIISVSVHKGLTA